MIVTTILYQCRVAIMENMLDRWDIKCIQYPLSSGQWIPRSPGDVCNCILSQTLYTNAAVPQVCIWWPADFYVICRKVWTHYDRLDNKMTAQVFIILLNWCEIFKIDFFLDFLFNIFRQQLTVGHWTYGKRTPIKWEFPEIPA